MIWLGIIGVILLVFGISYMSSQPRTGLAIACFGLVLMATCSLKLG